MKKPVIKFLLVCIIIVLIACRPSMTDSASSNPTQTPTAMVTRSLANSPTAPIQPPALGQVLIIDFGNCVPQRRRIDTAFGSTTFEIVGKQNDRCTLRYGGEIENPNWDGTLDTVCQVPLTLGEQILKTTDYGIDFSTLAPYCVKNPK